MSGTRPEMGPLGMGSAPGFGQLDVGIVGVGHVGAVLGTALRAEHRVVGVAVHSEASGERAETMLPGVPHLAANEVAERSDLVLLAVPDDALDKVVADLASAGAWRQGQLVWHTAGRFGAGVLAPAAAAGALTIAAHPAMTFSGTSLDLGRLPGTHWALTAAPMLLPIGAALIGELGGIAVQVREEARPMYHAALAHGANHLVTLLDQCVSVLRRAGIDDPQAFVAPLVSAALERALAAGPSALSGPAARGDLGTIAAHAIALADLEGQEARTIRRSYAEMARATALMAAQAGLIDAATAQAIGALVADDGDAEDRDAGGVEEAGERREAKEKE